MGSVDRLPAMSPPPPPPSARPGSSTSATVSESAEHDDEQDPGEVESITPWPTSPVAAQIPVSPTVPSNGMPTLDPPKAHVWVNTMDGRSRPVGVSADANYEPPKPLGIRDAFLIRHDMEAAFRYMEDEDDENKDKDKDKTGKEQPSSSSDTSTTPSTKAQLTPSMQAMDINDKRVDDDKDEPESEKDMVVDPLPTSSTIPKPTFSLSPSVDWKRSTKTSSEESGPITPQDAPSFTPSYLEKRRPAPRQSSQDTGSDYSTTPAPSYRVIRGPGSSSISAPIFKPPPRRSKPEPEPSLSRSGPSRRAAARARIATQKAQLESEEEEEEEEYWDDDGEDEVDELKSSPPAKPTKKTKVSLGKDDGAYDLDSDDDVPGPLVSVPRKRGRPPNSSLVGGKRRKTGDRYPCTVAGCTKTFTRRNDVERHIKSSGAHPEIKIVDESKRSQSQSQRGGDGGGGIISFASENSRTKVVMRYRLPASRSTKHPYPPGFNGYHFKAIIFLTFPLVLYMCIIALIFAHIPTSFSSYRFPCINVETQYPLWGLMLFILMPRNLKAIMGCATSPDCRTRRSRRLAHDQRSLRLPVAQPIYQE